MIFGRRAPFYGVIILGLFVVVGWYLGTFEKEPEYSHISLIQVQSAQVTIAWGSEAPESGSVEYCPIGSSDNARTIVHESGGPVREHQVTIKGLRPGTRYVYTIGNSTKKYYFQSQQEYGAAFSFMILWGDAVARAGGYLISEMPSFYLLLSDPAKQELESLEDIWPYVPFFSYGADSVIRPYKGRVGPISSQSSNLRWAGFSLLPLNDFLSMVDNKGELTAHTISVIAPAGQFFDKDGPCSLDRACIAQSALHAAIAEYNRKHSNHPVNFVLIPSTAIMEYEVDSIKYFGLPTGPGEAGAIRVDVHGESVYAVVLDQNKEIVLKAPPMVKYRTCEDCRRLATRGAYQDSITAYQKFITLNKDHYQLDDAYYAIAEIHDTKIFRYKEAITWYQRLAIRYPESTLTPLALQRIAFIQAHADHDFEPLKKFESIKRMASGRNDSISRPKLAVLEQAETILSDFPGSTLAPMISYWLASQYRDVSAEKAIHWYEYMIERFPAHPLAKTVWWDIALVYYEADQYANAVKAFEKAKTQQPKIEKEIDAQIKRVNRNRLRDALLWASRSLLAFLVAVSFLKNPLGMEKRSLWIALMIFLSIGCIYAIAAWLIHEQFNSFKEIILLVGGFAVLLSLGYPVSRSFAKKFVRPNPETPGETIAVIITAVTLHGLFIAAGVYQIIYHTNRHYLVILGL